MSSLLHLFPNGLRLDDLSPPVVVHDPAEQLRQAIMDAGMTPPSGPIILDGQFQRFSVNGKLRDDAGWYFGFDLGNGIAAGAFGNWRTNMRATWKANPGRELSSVEQMQRNKRLEDLRKIREADIAAARAKAADTAQAIWDQAEPAPADHPYLVRKGIKPHGLRLADDGRLVAPMYADAELVSVQYIPADEGGKKLFLAGSKTKGAWWAIGSLAGARQVYLAEGVATAATVHETTGEPVAVCYSAGNMPAAAQALREVVGLGVELVMVADHDKHGIGEQEAKKAAELVGGRVVMPPIEGMDANDYARAGHDLAALLAPVEVSENVVSKLQVIFGDQLGDEYEAPDELVEGLMTIGSSVVVYGDSNSGKTFWALSVATAIATGRECYGRRTDSGLVVYLASEAPGSIRSRMQAIKKYHGCDLENLAMVPVPMNFYSGDGDALDVINLVQEIERIKGKPVRLIIGDTLARMSAGANENSGEDMGPVMARFDAVASATGATMMIIHHNGKDAAKGARGWSGIRAHIDTEIEVSEKDGTRSVTVTKQRELPGKGETIYFKLEVIQMGVSKFGEPATTCVAVPDHDAEATKPTKKASKADELAAKLEKAWWESGAEELNGTPYISRSALREWFIKNGVSERTAKNNTEASRTGSFIEQLISAGKASPASNGWVFADPVQLSAIALARLALRSRKS